MPALYTGASKQHGARKKQQLSTEERKEKREAQAERHDEFEAAFAEWYGEWYEGAKSMADTHGVPLSKILAMFGAKMGEGKSERSATAYNAWQSVEIKQLYEGCVRECRRTLSSCSRVWSDYSAQHL